MGMSDFDMSGALALPAPGGAGAGAGMFAAQGAVPGMDLGSAAAAARDALEKAKRAAMFQRQIQEQMAKLKNRGLAAGFLPGEGPKARKLILDEFGRELDEEGNVVPMRPQTVSTLKVNINREKEARLKKILGLKKEPTTASSNHWSVATEGKIANPWTTLRTTRKNTPQ